VLPHSPEAPKPRRFPSRQAYEASVAVARGHGLADMQVSFAQQQPKAIDAGVFHNDVIAVGNENVLLFHENAFLDSPRVVRTLRRQFDALHAGAELQCVEVRARDVPLTDAVRSYLFNSQLVTTGLNEMALIAPVECRGTASVQRYLEKLVARGNTPIRQVHYLDLRQSMRNGGGPACLRLRVVLTPAEERAMAAGVRFTPQLQAKLELWVKKHYRDELRPRDLMDVELLNESNRALDQLTDLLGLGSIYPFQRPG